MTKSLEGNDSVCRGAPERSANLLNDTNLTNPENTKTITGMKPGENLPPDFGNLVFFDSTKSPTTSKTAQAQQMPLSKQEDFLRFFDRVDQNRDGSVNWAELCFAEESGGDGVLSRNEFNRYQQRVNGPDSPDGKPGGDGGDLPVPPIGKPGGDGGDRPVPPIGKPGGDGGDRPVPPIGKPGDGGDRPVPPIGKPGGDGDRHVPPNGKPGDGGDRPVPPIDDLPVPHGRNQVPRLPGQMLVNDSIKDGSISPFKRHLLDDSGKQGNMPDIQWVDAGNGDKAARFIQVKDPTDLRRNRRNSITDTSAAMRLVNDGSIYNYAFSTRLVEMPQSTEHANLFAFHDAPADSSKWGAKVENPRLGGSIVLAVKNGQYTFFSGGNDDRIGSSKAIWKAPYKEGEFVDWRIRVRPATEDDPKAKQDQAFTELYMNGKLVARATGWNQHGHDLSPERNKMANYSYMNAGLSAGFSWSKRNAQADRRVVDIGYITASKER